MAADHPEYGPDPERPLMMIRLRIGHEKPEIWNRLLPLLKDHRECCDEVWFSTGIGIPPLAEHRRISALMADHAEELRHAGIIPSLQLQTTIGHGDGIIAEAGADGKTWGSYVGIHGEQCRYISCPRQPGFLDHMRETAKIYAQWHPGSVWIDDDLRLHNHHPAMDHGGCCCPLCLAQFAEEEGRAFTREEIESAWQTGNDLKRRWEDFQIRSLLRVVEVIAGAVHEISPTTRFGLQHAGEPFRSRIFEVMRETTGSRSGSRPGGGAYSDRRPFALIEKSIYLSMQMNSQSTYEVLGQVCSEIETYPRVFTCRTAQGLRVESLLHLAMGMDSLSYFIMDPVYETPEWYGRELLEPLAKDAPCFREYLRHNAGTLPGGVGLCCPKRLMVHNVEKLGLPLAGVPFGAFSAAAACRQLDAETAEKTSDEELEEALSGDVLLDGAAVQVVAQRGMSRLIGGITARLVQGSVFEYCTDDPINAGLDNVKNFTFSGMKFAFDVPGGAKCRLLSRYRDVRDQDFGPGALLLEGPGGARAALLGHDGFNTKYISSSRVRFLYRVAAWCAHDELPAAAAEPVQCLIVPRIAPDRTLRSVCVLNVTIGQQKPFALKLRNVPADISEAEWRVPSEPPLRVALRRDGAEAEATLPGISAWSIGWLKIG